jgi:Smg protein
MGGPVIANLKQASEGHQNEGQEMKESVLDILIYLFENYSDPDFDPDVASGEVSDAETKIRASLRRDLEQAGFRATIIDSAFAWLDTLASSSERHVTPAARSVRVFADRECAKLDGDCRNYILYLENIGILTPAQREIVIDRLLALDSAMVDIDQTKWVVLMVLFSQPGHEDAYARMEELLFSGRAAALH